MLRRSVCDILLALSIFFFHKTLLDMHFQGKGAQTCKMLYGLNSDI